jgi:septum formation protein
VRRLILASGSLRRRELLAALVDDFEVQPPDIPEELTGDAVGDALRLALAKAGVVARLRPEAVVIGSDTIVHDGARPYGKPGTPAEAREILRVLAGRPHLAVTAVAAISTGGDALSGTSTTTVHMAALSAASIDAYVASGRPMDKAGAYAIQDEDVPTVASIDGCYCGVMGLPLWLTRRLLESAGVTCSDPARTFTRCSSCPERLR